MLQGLARTSTGKIIQVFVGGRAEAMSFYDSYYASFSEMELIESMAVAEAFLMDNLPYKEVGIKFFGAVKILSNFCRKRLYSMDPEGLMLDRLDVKLIFKLIDFGRRCRAANKL